MDDTTNDGYFEVSVDDTVAPPSVSASGELDAASSTRLRQAIDDALTAGGGVSLDLGAVTFIDSSALRVITIAVRRANDDGQPFQVTAASDAVRRIFEITGVASLLAP